MPPLFHLVRARDSPEERSGLAAGGEGGGRERERDVSPALVSGLVVALASVRVNMCSVFFFSPSGFRDG